MVVLFPAPLGPRNPNTSPRLTANETPSTAVNGPNRLVSPRISIMLTSWLFCSDGTPRGGSRREAGTRVHTGGCHSSPFATAVQSADWGRSELARAGVGGY